MEATKLSYKRPQGGVYLIKNGDIYKIGRSSNLASRLSNHRWHMPDMEVIQVIVSTQHKLLEEFLHKTFDRQRIAPRGEWFRLSDLDVAYFCCLPDDVENQELREIENSLGGIEHHCQRLSRYRRSRVGGIAYYPTRVIHVSNGWWGWMYPNEQLPQPRQRRQVM